MLNYLHLRGYRNLCEYLNSQKYKIATIEEISKECSVLPILYNPKDKRISSYLYNNYLIQFTSFCKHPILNYTSSRKIMKEYQYYYGWRLVSDWEFKIDYLEKLILFNQEGTTKAWEKNLLSRINKRENQEKLELLKKKFRTMTDLECMIECEKLEICWRCFQPILKLMVDCVQCGAKQL